MFVTHATQIVYSPCGHTRSAVKSVAKGTGLPSSKHDITKPNPKPLSNIDMDDIAIVGSPAYAGHLPKIAVNRLKPLTGTFSAALAVVTFGMHTYGTALHELCDLLANSGFTVAGAIAVPCGHAMFPVDDAADAPDAKLCESFGALAMDKISSVRSAIELPPLSIPVQPVEKPALESGFKAECDSTRCVRCGICAALCPASSIPFDNPTLTDARTCCACMACVKYCPVSARSLRPFNKLEKAKSLMKEIARDASPGTMTL